MRGTTRSNTSGRLANIPLHLRGRSGQSRLNLLLRVGSTAPQARLKLIHARRRDEHKHCGQACLTHLCDTCTQNRFDTTSWTSRQAQPLQSSYLSCSLDVDIKHTAAARICDILHGLDRGAINVTMNVRMLQELSLLDGCLKCLSCREVVVLPILKERVVIVMNPVIYFLAPAAAPSGTHPPSPQAWGRAWCGCRRSQSVNWCS